MGTESLRQFERRDFLFAYRGRLLRLVSGICHRATFGLLDEWYLRLLPDRHPRVGVVPLNEDFWHWRLAQPRLESDRNRSWVAASGYVVGNG